MEPMYWGRAAIINKRPAGHAGPSILTHPHFIFTCTTSYNETRRSTKRRKQSGFIITCKMFLFLFFSYFYIYRQMG